MQLYHGSNQVIERPEIRVQRFYKDFGWGFYCTKLKEQAARWAVRRGRTGVINSYAYDEAPSLSILRFPEMNEAWLDFIAACRAGQEHSYDVVEGQWPMTRSLRQYRIIGMRGSRRNFASRFVGETAGILVYFKV